MMSRAEGVKEGDQDHTETRQRERGALGDKGTSILHTPNDPTAPHTLTVCLVM